MSKWSEEFIGTFEDTGKVKRMTEQFKKINKEEAKRIRELLGKYNPKQLK